MAHPAAAYAENSGPCANRNYLRTARASASRSARRRSQAMKNRTDVTTNGFIAVGISAGGFASVALTADPPPGLVAVISFAGGRGSRDDDDVCDEDSLVARVRSARQDVAHSDAVDLCGERQVLRARTGAPDARRLHRAPAAAPSSSMLAAFGEDGHSLFSRGIAIWTPDGRRFSARAKSGPARSAAAAEPAALPPPPRLGEKGRAGFADLPRGRAAQGVCDVAARRAWAFAIRIAIGGRGAGQSRSRAAASMRRIARSTPSTMRWRRKRTPGASSAACLGIANDPLRQLGWTGFQTLKRIAAILGDNRSKLK